MKRTNRPPFIFRLMLLSIFLPIGITAGIGLVDLIASNLFDPSQPLLIGIPIAWVLLFLVTFPLFLGILIFHTGKWQLPALVAATLYFSFYGLMVLESFENDRIYTPPEKRFIRWEFNSSRIPDEIDVYCNDIYLGQIPLKIRVDEFVEKVPEWTSPPEQRFYDEQTTSYTWLPWDDFRKEQFVKTQELLNFREQSGLSLSPDALAAARKKQITKYDSDCRYWWRFESSKNQLIAQKKFFVNSSTFEKVLDGYLCDMDNLFSPSAAMHTWLLVDVLDQLTESEKNDWDKHVLKHWSLLGKSLPQQLTEEARRYRLKNRNDPRIKIFETALDSVARLKYGLSNPPTEEECRQLLTHWVNETYNVDKRTFQFSNKYSSKISNTTGLQVEVVSAEAPLIDVAIKLMGTTVRKPLAEQWKKNDYKSDQSKAPLIYISKIDRGAEYFDDFARYLVTTKNGRLELLENQNEKVIPLFRTFLYRKSFLDFIKRDAGYSQQLVEYYQQLVLFYSNVNNPLLEQVFREYIVYILSDLRYSAINYNKLQEDITNILHARIAQENIDKNELAVWIASLPLHQASKDILIQQIETVHNKTISFANFLQLHGIISKTKITAEDVNRWFAENPDGTLKMFFETFEDDFQLSDEINVPNYKDPNGKYWTHAKALVLALLFTNTPETQKTIKQLCNNKDNRYLVSIALRLQFGSGVVFDHDFLESFSKNLFNFSIEYPDFMFDIFETF
ncbi:MAG: hypothetical protein LBI18_05745, partial [Planctomycetaceae bacterium]|nr:hypothetical protein [Planctomycetaceae bacterium]